MDTLRCGDPEKKKKKNRFFKIIYFDEKIFLEWTWDHFRKLQSFLFQYKQVAWEFFFFFILNLSSKLFHFRKKKNQKNQFFESPKKKKSFFSSFISIIRPNSRDLLDISQNLGKKKKIIMTRKKNYVIFFFTVFKKKYYD